MNVAADARVYGYAPIDKTSKHMPPPSYEYWFYAQMFYSIMGSVLGISISLLGIAMLASLAGLCAIRMGRYARAVLRPIAAALACGVTFTVVQVLIHGEPLMGDAVREMLAWMVGLFVLQYLALRRGFLHRLSIVVFLIGLSTLPYVKSFAYDASRAGLNKAITIANPNDFGAWFGFCFVYFTILGLETRRTWMRAISWTCAVSSLLVVGLTVSRAPLLAAAVSIVLAFRRVLKRGFFPFFALIAMAWVAYGLGWFDQAVAMYARRGLEETGRLTVWPIAIGRFLQSPLAGVGSSQILTYLPTAGVSIAPHNGFITMGMVAGVVPLLFFIAYWVQLFAKVFFGADAGSREDGPFQSALLMYSFLINMTLNGAFMVPWMMAIFASVGGTGSVLNVQRAVSGQIDASRALRRRGLPAVAGRSRA